VNGQTITIPFFNDTFSVTPENIVDHKGTRPPHSVCVVLCQYLLLSPDEPNADEDFPADCSLLFEKQAARYLDMECLAMIAMVLAERLAGKDNPDMAMLA